MNNPHCSKSLHTRSLSLVTKSLHTHNDFDFAWTKQEVTPELLIDVYRDIIVAVNELNDKKGIEAFFENQLWVEDESDVINSLIREFMIIEDSFKKWENSMDVNK